MSDRRIARHDLAPLRSSAACTDGLTKQQSLRVIDELERVLAERDEVMRILGELSEGPWPEVRRLLAELHRLIGPRGRQEPTSGLNGAAATRSTPGAR